MMDATPYTVIRRDIKSFYESIDHESLRERLLFDTSIPRSMRHYLSEFFEAHCPKGAPGLPRGIGLTATLVELAMERFDQKVRSLPGVYRYFRYSDDIVIFCYKNEGEVERLLPSLLPEGMRFNLKKHAIASFDQKKVKGTVSNGSFEYLGYTFSTNDGTGDREPREVHVGISPSKVRKIKTRIVLALKIFKKDRDAKLLLDRLNFLSGNFRLTRQGVTVRPIKKKIKSGIYYNYQRCGSYKGNVFTAVPPQELASIDNFTHHLLKHRKSEFSHTLKSHLTPAQLSQLDRISFFRGYVSRRMIRLDYSRLTTIKGAWRND